MKTIGRHVLVLLAAGILGGCGPQAFVIRQVPARQNLTETRIGRDAGLLVFDKIAVIDVDGILTNRARGGMFGSGDNPVSLFQEKLDRAAGDSLVKAVVLRINSPGGTVAASDMMYHALLDFKRKTTKPVVACMLDVAASGAYYLACGADGIVAAPATITGSIGTIFQTVSFAGTMDKLGIKAETIKSGKLKDLASPLHDMSAAEREILRGIIDHFYAAFLDVVLAGRSDLQRDDLLELADGRVFTAETARSVGLIDRIGYPADAVAWAKQQAGVNRVRVVIYHRPIGYKPNVYASATDPAFSAGLVNIELLPDWLQSQGPHFLYIWCPGRLSDD